MPEMSVFKNILLMYSNKCVKSCKKPCFLVLRGRRSHSRSLSSSQRHSFAVVKNATSIICHIGSVGHTSPANFRAFHDCTFGSVIGKYLAEDLQTTSSRKVVMCCARCAVHCFTRFNKYL